MRKPKIFHWVRMAFVSLVSKDSEIHPKAQLTESGKSYEAIRLSPYGFCSNSPKGSFSVVLAPSYNGEDTKFVISNDHPNRFKNLKEGEVAVGNYETRAEIFFDESGNINVRVPDGNLNADVSGNLTAEIGGSATVNVTGSLTADVDGGATITTPNLTVNGNLSVNGNFSFSGTGSGAGSNPMTISGGISNTGGDITSDGISLESHVHGGVSTGSDTTNEPEG